MHAVMTGCDGFDVCLNVPAVHVMSVERKIKQAGVIKNSYVFRARALSVSQLRGENRNVMRRFRIRRRKNDEF